MKRPGVSVLARLEDRLHCQGFWGFGGGYQMAIRHEKPQNRRPSYCNAGCARAQACWEAHRQRIDQVMPAATGEFKKIVAEVGPGPQAVKVFHERFGVVDPYIAAAAANLEDGISAAATGRIKDRGVHTLPYPFPVERGV